jgi:hypothetical protein
MVIDKNNDLWFGTNIGLIKHSEFITDVINSDFATSSLIKSVSPNPAGDYIDVILSEAKHPVLSVNVYNVLGACVLTHPLVPSREEESIRLDVSGLAAGVYFVKIDNKIYKFVKM